MIYFLDIDGTLADATERFKQAGPEPSRSNRKQYLKWLAAVQDEQRLANDEPVWAMLPLVEALAKSGGTVFYLTSREEQYREVTKQWLEDNMFPKAPLIMRAADDWRSSGELKADAMRVILQASNLEPCDAVLIDDDPRGDVQQAAHELGVCFLKATSGGKG
jgi:FMN phosphatase YigB (HAD superfamily)